MSEAARALGVSDRSLQRELKKNGTRFRDELIAARIEAAGDYLSEPDLKIETVAELVGMSSHSHLTSLSSPAQRRTPVQYRERMSVRREVEHIDAGTREHARRSAASGSRRSDSTVRVANGR